MRAIRGFQNEVGGSIAVSPSEPESVRDWAWNDFLSSTPQGKEKEMREIFDRLIETLEGDHACAEMELSRSAGISYSPKVRAKAQAISSGIWFTYGFTPDGELGTVIYAKPRKPRLDNASGKVKTVKYETRYGDPATPVLLEPPRSAPCWKPILVGEGVKKGACLLAHGYETIALRGVTCGNKPGTKELHPHIEHFATKGQEFIIVFDQDTKPKTIVNVSREIHKLGKALEAKGCKVRVLIWNPELGKGIDDCLVGQGTNSQRFLDQLISRAPTLDLWTRQNYNQYLLELLDRLQSPGIEPERITEGPELPELPSLEYGAIHAIDAYQATGKTKRIGPDYARKFTDDGGFVLVISPLLSLGKGVAKRWGYPHLDEIDTADRDQWIVLRHQVDEAGGIVICPNSLHRVQEFIDSDRPLLIVFDEVNQTCQELAFGNTIKDRQVQIVELLAKNLKQAVNNGAIVIAEDGVYKRSIDLIKRLSKCERVRLFKHKGVPKPWDCAVSASSPSGYVAAYLYPAMRSNKKIILALSSKNQGRKIERLLLPMGKTVIRIDSETNRNGTFEKFFESPNDYLKSLPSLPDVLIYTPSVKSGVSIELPGFDEAHGLFTSGDSASWSQMIGRYRLPVPRKVVVGDRILPDSHHQQMLNRNKVAADLALNLEGYRRVFDCPESEVDLELAETAIEMEEAIREFYCDEATAVGIQKTLPLLSLRRLLQQKGHTVESPQVDKDKDIGDELKAIQEEIWREDALAISKSNPGDMSVKEANKKLNSSGISLEVEFAARKVLWRAEFPGVDFNDPEDCYAALTENFGSLRRGVLLQVQAQNLDRAKTEESERVAEVLKRNLKLVHKLPQGFFRAALLNRIGILLLLDGNPYHENDDRIVHIKSQALHFAGEIRKYFLININESQTGIEIANKLLRRIALKAKCIHREGGRGEQIRIWGIPTLCDPIRLKLLQAATERIGGDQSAIITEFPKSYWDVIQKAKAKKQKQKQLNKPIEDDDDDEDYEDLIEFDKSQLVEDFLESDDGWSFEVGDDND